MSARRPASTGQDGFSLIEVVLALSILTYALVAILMLFPLALNTATDSKSDSRATFIAQSLLAEIQSGTGTSREILSQITGSEQADTALGPRSSSSSFNLAATADGQPLYIAFDSSGNPLRELSAADYNQGTTVANAIYISRLSAAANPDNNPATSYNYSRVTLTVEWPAAAKPVQRNKQVFVTLIVPNL